MTTVNYQVSSGDDDAYEYQDDLNFDGTDTKVRASSHTVEDSRTIAGLRFTSVAVPKAAQIITATLQVNVLNTANDDVNIDIHAEDVDNAVSFVTDADVVNRLPLTTASVAWVADGLGAGFKTSPELKTVIQEIVDRGSWASGNALVVLMKGKSDVNKSFIALTYESAPGNAAKLDITYAVTRKRSYARAIL